MNEVYQNSTHYVYLDILGGSADEPPTATLFRDSADSATLIVNGPETIEDGERWTAMLNLAHTQTVQELKVVWTFNLDGEAASKTDYLDVVVPLVTLSDIKSNLDIDDEYSDNEIMATERRVRKIIEAYTGQEFASKTETLTLRGTGSDVLKLPKRAVSITSVNGNELAGTQNFLEISNNGWGLTKFYPYYSGNIKAGGWPIEAPYSRDLYSWRGNVRWQITGKFGWDRVPVEIQEAALILIEQELCQESVYRNRFIETMTAADWRIEFVQQAYKRTGNVIADQILAKFKMNNSAVF